MTRFIGDTVYILYLIATAAISLSLNLVTLTLRLLAQAIETYVATISAILAVYLGRINAVLHPGAPKGVTIQ